MAVRVVRQRGHPWTVQVVQMKVLFFGHLHQVWQAIRAFLMP